MTLAPDGFTRIWSRLPDLYGSRPMLVWNDDGSAFPAGDVHLLAQAFARLVLDRAGRGATVALCAATRPETLVAVWGTWLAGGTVAPMDPGQGASFLDHAMALAHPALCVAERPIGTAPTLLIDELGATLAAHAGHHIPLGLAGDDDPGALLFTSGSSGQPKGVLLSRGGLWRSADALTGTYGWNAADVLLCTAPLHTMSGLRNPALAAPLAGATLVLDSSPPLARAIAVGAACRRHGVTVLTTAPALLDLLTQRGDSGPTALRMVLTTGTPLHPHTAGAAGAMLGVPVYDYYGMTETTGACIMMPPGPAPVAPGMIGRPTGCRVMIRGTDGSACPDGMAGELLVGGDNLMLGYVGDPQATARVLRDGWLHTGDMAIRHPDGMIQLKGRRDGQVKTPDGEPLYPAEAEAALRCHPQVRDAHVRAVPDPAGTPALVAEVVFDGPDEPREKEASLRRHLKKTWKHGDILHRITFPPAIERTGHGKVVSRQNRENR